jgi:hypothetical protein
MNIWATVKVKEEVEIVKSEGNEEGQNKTKAKVFHFCTITSELPIKFI